ncbi:NAD(P)H-dependent oxidoreductase [Ruegeria marina]|uniref:Putative NADPH-quinone reductase (Modulator of drug activity B) n=1 Tax=Ruegeria marina TaxID=639004 RepID=A0A1G6V0S2_9RHOB|nr:NAD(P)H-dependent oxidoreductase [Ruegeria marina]SDD47112.1 Putative NADPH-quinone reductase (modulator of drug activity B) [Ruegeria marina]
MRVLIVFAHPSEQSYGAALLATANEALVQNGHDVQVIDLYRTNFDPVLSLQDWNDYISDTGRLIEKVSPHVEAMRWAEALVLVYPTWMYGPPAILKGWLERVWLPGVAFDIPDGLKKRARGKLQNIKSFTVITTSGSPWWWLRLIRDPGRSLLARGYRVLFHPHCRMRWLQLHDMNHRSGPDRARFIKRVSRTMAKI